MCRNALHHVTVVDWLLSQMCIISFHRDCKALQDLLDPGDCQEKLYVLCHFSSCSWGVWTVRQWSSATQVTLAAPFVGGTAAIRCWSTVGWDLSTGHHLEFQETIYILLLKLFDRLEWIWILGSLKWGLFTLVPLLAFCSLASHSSWETIAWLGWLSSKLSWFVLCSCWQLPSTDVTGQGFSEMLCACGCKTAVLECQALVLLSRAEMFLYLLHFWVPHIQVCQLIGQGDGSLLHGGFSVPVTITPPGNILMGLLAGWDFSNW